MMQAFSHSFARRHRSQSVTCLAGSHDIIPHDDGMSDFVGIIFL